MAKAKTKKMAQKPGTNRQVELSNHRLGQQVDYHYEYSPDFLEAIENRHAGSQAWTSFVCTEFTSLCPKTGQPDFARVFINYIADEKLVESKSLKMYLFSFRNHGDFHEDCIQTICDDIFKLIKPCYIEVVGEFTPRGGIAIFPFATRANEQKEFQDLRKTRREKYAPGKYSLAMAKVYG